VSRLFAVPALGCALAVSPLAAQLGAGSPAAAYLERYREVMKLAPQPGQVAEVNHLALSRDVCRLALERGTLYLLSPVGGRTVGAVFRGRGRLTFAPSVPAEQAELQRFVGSPSLDDTLTELILIFSDSTADQLRGLTFGQGDIPGDVADHVRDLVGSLKGDNEGSFSGAVMGPLLNSELTGFFLARVERAHGGPVLFQINPEVTEAVQLYRPVSRLRWGANWAVVTQFPRPTAADMAGAWILREQLGVPAYKIDVRLPLNSSGSIGFSASAMLTLRVNEPVGPWLRFFLYPKLLTDSARWSSGDSAAVFKAKDDDDVWVRAPHRLQPGDSLSLTIFYHGDLIERLARWFFVSPLASWYPKNGQGRTFALFDVTYRAPSFYPLATIGDRVDSALANNVVTTRWVTKRPTSFASFNLGDFQNYHVERPGEPSLDVLLSEDAHRELRHAAIAAGVYLPQQTHMLENVAADVSNSLKLFTLLFGASPFSHFYVTEIPFGEGVSFPGMIDLSWVTFQATTLDGFDEWFRAHEVAHQWWGNGVGPGSYRDAWLSEGLASFSALLYLQSESEHKDRYFKYLDHYKTDIKGEKGDVGPIWIGARNATPDVRQGYNVMIYEKGAWVFHMLRMMMLDLGTGKDDRFTAMMRDYYASYLGKVATTDDFQGVVERHTGMPMDWFFDEWVKGTAIPTYHVAWKAEPTADGKYTVRLRVTQEHVPPDFRMFVLVSADLGNNRFAHFRVQVGGTQGEYVSPVLPAEPKELKFNDLSSVLADVKMERW